MKKLLCLLIFILLIFVSPTLIAQTIVYGIVPDAHPTTFVDEEGNPTGFFVELFTAIMDDLKIEYVIEVAPFSELYPKLLDGDVDFFTTLLKSEEREKFFHFADESPQTGWGQLFTSSSQNYRGIQSLNHKEIGMVKDDLVGINFKSFMDELGIIFTPVEFTHFTELFDAVRNGDVYGGVIYSASLFSVKGVNITATVFSPIAGYPVTNIDNEFKPELDAISDRLRELREDPDSYYYELHKKWFSPASDMSRETLTIIISVFILLLFIIILLYINRRYLDRMVKQRTVELEDAASIFKNSVEGIIITDKDLIITKVNEAFEHITGFNSSEVLGKESDMMKSAGKNYSLFDKNGNSTMKNDEWKGELWARKKTGELYPQLTSIIAIRDDRENIRGYSSVFSDLSENKKLEEQYNHLSYFDKLTSLPNKILFQDRLKMAAGKVDRENNLLAIICLGLDNFSNVNNRYGQEIGDTLLQIVGTRLEGACRKTDTISRYGGDEFNILLNDIHNLEDVRIIISKIQESLRMPFEIAGEKIFSSGTQGISIYPTDDKEINTVLKNSNLALRNAKTAGKGTFAFYRKEDDIALKRRHDLENQLRTSLEKDEIKVHYQPKFSLVDNRISGIEALIRWYRSNGEIIYPDDFIPILEESGLIVPIGEFVIRKACEDISKLNEGRDKPLKLAVNLSGVQFSDEKLVNKIMNILDETKFPAENLEVEITESIAMDNLNNTIDVLDQLNSKNISIAVDDFGTGYSSLSYIQRFPLRTLKIDKSFINKIPGKQSDVALVRSIISLAEVMNINVIAEGVETESQLNFLKENNCREIQGYYISKPISLEKIRALVDKKL